MYDIIIIGAGPAGLTAAVYARRAGKTVLVIEKGTFGGQITYSPRVENIPGFISLTGNEFAEKLVEQALNLGAEIECAEVTGICDGEIKTVNTDSGDYQGKAVIIATGAKHRLLGVQGEEEYIGEGISFCAVCDGAFYEGKDVAVIGGGNSALQEALLLSETSRKVYVVQNLSFITGEKALYDKLCEKSNVEVVFDAVVDSFVGDNGTLKGIVIDVKGEKKQLIVDGVFVAIGLVPQNEPFAKLIKLDERGYVDASEACMTDCKGVFVAGDCRQKQIRQVTTAASDGAVAALAAVKYLDN